MRSPRRVGGLGLTIYVAARDQTSHAVQCRSAAATVNWGRESYTVKPLFLAALNFWRFGLLNYFGAFNFGVFAC